MKKKKNIIKIKFFIENKTTLIISLSFPLLVILLKYLKKEKNLIKHENKLK